MFHKRPVDLLCDQRKPLLSGIGGQRYDDDPSPGVRRILDGTTTGVDAFLLGGEKTEVLILPGRGLGAVAVVHVEIDHGHAL